MGNVWIRPWANFVPYMDPTFIGFGLKIHSKAITNSASGPAYQDVEKTGWNRNWSLNDRSCRTVSEVELELLSSLKSGFLGALHLQFTV